MLERPIAADIDAEPMGACEVAALIQQFETSEWQRLKLAARRLGERASIDPDDLLQEASYRVLRGSRKIVRGRDAVWTMIGAMKSIASNEIEKREGVLRPLIVPPEFFELFASEDLGPESFTISTVDDGRLLARVRAALAGDHELLNLVEALCDGLFGERLEQALEIDRGRLAALRTRLKRRLRELAGQFRGDRGE